MYKKIIVAVDIGQMEKGEKILAKAHSLLDEGGEIVLLNAVEDAPGYLTIDLPADFLDATIREARARLDELNTTTGVGARVEIRKGPAAREIISAAEDHRADLVVLASHIPDLSNYFLGATADRVVRHAKCSVLVDR